MNGAGAGHFAESVAIAGAKIAQAINGVVIAGSTARIGSQIEELVSNGVLEEDHGPLTCTKCKEVIDNDMSTCSRCGAVLGEEDNPPGSIEEEFEQESETPVHGSTIEKEYEDAPIHFDLPRRFEEVLIELGWNEDESEHGGLILARIWETAERLPPDKEIFRKSVEEMDNYYKKMLEPAAVEERILEEFNELFEEKEKETQPVPCEIHIFKEFDEEWIVKVDDPLNNIDLSNPAGSVSFGDFTLSVKKFLRLLEERRRNLENLGNKLIELRNEFFEAITPEDAKETLGTKALSQTTMAREAGIHESTLSRWCSKGAVWISTPHGVFPLSDFFKRPSRTRTDRDLTIEAVKKIVKEAKKVVNELYPEQNQTEAILTYLKNEHEITMTDRTLREYLKTRSKSPRQGL